MMNKFDLAKIFHSNYTASTDWEMMEEVSLMLEEGMLEIQSVIAANYADFLKAIDQIGTEKYKHVVESGDSIRHQALKIIATNFLVKRFSIKPGDIKYEPSFFLTPRIVIPWQPIFLSLNPSLKNISPLNTNI